MESSPPTAEDNSREKDYRHRSAAFEANQLHAKDLPPERIGKVMVSAETQPRKRTERTRASDIAINKRVGTMDRTELLKLSKEIAVEGTSLSQIYETHLLSENGLRRLVIEHLQGGDIKALLRQELLEHEIDFERDPILRDRPKQASTASESDTLDNLLKRVNATSGADTKEELAVFKAREAYQSEQQAQQRYRRRFIDVSLAGIIIILLILVIVLAMSRS